MSDLIERQAAIDGLKRYIDDKGIFNQDRWFVHGIRTAIMHLQGMPSAQPEIVEQLYRSKCYITDKEGLQHEVVHTGDIRRITGWEI